MTVALAIRFPLGRYHATAWGRAVNEAAVDWPPSPWRLLRALYATWRWRAPELDATTVAGVLDALSLPPSYRMPRYTLGHTRHYMPDAAMGKDKVIDAFAVVDPDARLVVGWDAELDAQQTAVLADLCRLLPCLGRAEAICNAELLTADALAEIADGKWLRPGYNKAGGSPTRLLAPTIPLDVPALLSSTTAVRRAGLTLPPGARWVDYDVPAPERPPDLTRVPAKLARPAPTAVRLALAAPALPSVYEAVWYGDVLRRAAIKKHRLPSATLSGRPPGGDEDERRRDNHLHAHYLFLDTDGDRLLDTAVVWAPEGLSKDVVVALGRIRLLHVRSPRFRPVRLAIEALGPVEDVAPELGGTKRTSWMSATPFAPYRHQKPNVSVESFVQSAIDRELQTRQLGSAQARPVGGDGLRHLRSRQPGQRELRAFGVRIDFAEATTGPVVLGALSHFGLGRFAPVLDDRG